MIILGLVLMVLGIGILLHSVYIMKTTPDIKEFDSIGRLYYITPPEVSKWATIGGVAGLLIILGMATASKFYFGY